MTVGATLTDLVLYAPWAFLVGVGVGLGAASRWHIVRRPNGWDSRK